MSAVSRKTVVIMLSNLLGAVAGYIVLLMVGRYLEPGAYGAYIFAVGLVGIFAEISKLGFGQAHTREVARGTDLRQALGVFARIRTALVVAYATIFLVSLLVWFKVLGRTFTDATTLNVVLVILASSILTETRRVGTATWRGQGRIHRIEWANVVDAFVFAAGVVLVALSIASVSGRYIPIPGLGDLAAGALGMTERPGLADMAFYLAIAHFLGKVAATITYTAFWVRDKVQIGPWDPELARRYRSFALPVAFTGILSLLLTETDVVMVGFFWDANEVGYYGAARKLAKMALIPTVALKAVLFPYVSSLVGKGAPEQALQAFRRAERYLLIFVIPLALSMAVWAAPGLHIAVGDGFLPAAPALRYLALWTIVMALAMPVRMVHMAHGSSRTVLEVMLVNVGANVVLNLVFIPDSILGIQMLGLGAEGSALATLLSTVAAYAYNRYRARRDFGIPVLDMVQGRLALAGLGLALGWAALRHGLADSAYDRVWELAGFGAVGMLLYLGALWIVGALRKADIEFFRAALSPKGLAKEALGRGGRF